VFVDRGAIPTCDSDWDVGADVFVIVAVEETGDWDVANAVGGCVEDGVDVEDDN